MENFTKLTEFMIKKFSSWKINYLIFLLLLFTTSLFSQYSIDNKDLVKTTFQRTFDKKIINEYLLSNDERKIKAALLSISHSEDTSFVKEIIQLDFRKNEEYICFALGQIGKCKLSMNYLLDKLTEFPSQYLLEAIGKVTDDEFVDLVLERLKDVPDYSVVIYHLFNGGSILKEKAQDILIELIEINPTENNTFALYRIGPPDDSKHLMVQALKEISNESPEIIINLLGCLRKLKYFPDDSDFFYTSLNDVRSLLTTFAYVSIEYIKELCYYNFKSENELLTYLQFLSNENPNISRQTAISLSEININEELKPFLENEIKTSISSSDKTENVKGELFLSYQKLFPEKFRESKDELKQFVKDEFIYRAYGNMSSDISAMHYLLENYKVESEKNKIHILTSLLNFQKSFSDSKDLAELFLQSLSSESAPLISISADGIDSLFIINNTSVLKEIISNQISKFKNDSDFIEAVMSLTNLSEKIDIDFYQTITKEVGSSELYSVRKFIYKKQGKKFDELKESSLFDSFWENAFKYKTAEVTTVRGKFTIKFLPEYAPISVGNFCYLASKNFFNGIEFHRVVPGFVIQAGDPTGTGWGGPGYDIISEFSPLPFDIGSVGMASAGKDTEGSQWFVMQGNHPHLNGRYSVFGKVIEGLETVYNTDQGDKIISIKLVE